MTDIFPHADALKIDVDPSARWIMLNFSVGQQNAVLSMDANKIGDVLKAAIDAINMPQMRSIVAPAEEPGTVFQSEVMFPVAIGASVSHTGGIVTADFDLPGGTSLRFALALSEIERLKLALDQAAAIAGGGVHSKTN